MTWAGLVIVVLALGVWWAIGAQDAGDHATPLARSAPVVDAREPATDVELVSEPSAVREVVGQALPVVAIHEATPDVPDAEPAPQAPTAVLEGTVAGPDGIALTAKVELVHPVTGGARAVTSAAGYRIAGVEPGTWWLRVTHDAYRTQTASIELLPGPNRADVVLERPPAIEVHLVTSHGEPLASALDASPQRSWRPYVFATLEPTGTRPLMDSGGDHLGLGRFEDGQRLLMLRDRPGWTPGGRDPSQPPSWVGTLRVPVDPPFHVAASIGFDVLDVARVEPGTTEVTLTVDVEDVRAAWASLRLRLVSAETGDPLTKALVRIDSWTTSKKLEPGEPEGTYRVEEALAGAYRLTVEAVGYVGIGRDLVLTKDEQLDLGTLELERCATRACRVIDPSGGGVAANVEVLPGVPRIAFLRVLETAPDGRFALPIAHADGMRLRVRPFGHPAFEARLASRVVRVDPDGTDEVLVQLARCSTLVLRPPEETRTGWRWEVVDEAGELCASGESFDALPVSVELPVGRYEVVVVDAAGLERRRAVQVDERTAAIDVLGG